MTTFLKERQMSENLIHQCHQIAEHLVGKHDWRLCTAERLATSVLDRIQVMEQTGEKINITQLTLNEYVLRQYAACQPQQAQINMAEHNRAYEELGRYLYNMLFKLRPDWSEPEKEDATQMALVQIYQALQENKVREPGAFWAFAFNKLRGEIKRLERQREMGGQAPISIGPTTDSDETGMLPFINLPDETLPFMEQEIMRQQLCDDIIHQILRTFQLHPRAKQQLMAAFLKYAFDCSNAEIAERLEIPASSIASVIARGRKKFQANETLANLWEQLFELELS